ncbi:DUF3592 domain-containing protein [Solimonas sp. K1W22B-7]|uniref:DUF3592 domain-containing protein n=1 Tax=Solimonas sp. K1W22B-7 TaxID=2303331 RepID=UPI0013C4F1B5|nr:DUF3592 domain-containing protein [Solimonas sp. K1W22B-7]
MLPFILIFLVAGLGLVFIGRKFERQARLAARWPTVAGQLEHCEVAELRSRRIEETSSWQLQIRYSYVVGGVTYRSTQYAFGYGDGRDDGKHRIVADALKRQPQLLVHYDPAHPGTAVLSTQVRTNISTAGYATLGVALVSALIWIASC